MSSKRIGKPFLGAKYADARNTRIDYVCGLEKKRTWRIMLILGFAEARILVFCVNDGVIRLANE